MLSMFSSKCAWVIPSKDKKIETTTKAFQKNLNESGRKVFEKWCDECSKFYKRYVKS